MEYSNITLQLLLMGDNNTFSEYQPRGVRINIMQRDAQTLTVAHGIGDVSHIACSRLSNLSLDENHLCASGNNHIALEINIYRHYCISLYIILHLKTNCIHVCIIA